VTRNLVPSLRLGSVVLCRLLLALLIMTVIDNAERSSAGCGSRMCMTQAAATERCLQHCQGCNPLC
jgi:hypothetical protein